ncbi:MAG: nucleoside triphosphate pyrophosphohydrolase [Desulfurococcales archaeon]|nr:nucleoside triphosphate pyrophosphohydrolase [Desulfurococcales archaeon]
MDKCTKLVRDKIPEIISRGEIKFLLDKNEIEDFLLRKIVEEANELLEARNIEEAADLYEALRTWLKLKGLSIKELEEYAEAKKEKHGGFDKFYVWIYEC